MKAAIKSLKKRIEHLETGILAKKSVMDQQTIDAKKALDQIIANVIEIQEMEEAIKKLEEQGRIKK